MRRAHAIADIRAGEVAASIYHALGKRKGGGQGVTSSDIFPESARILSEGRAVPRVTPAESIAATMDLWVAATGGRAGGGEDGNE